MHFILFKVKFDGREIALSQKSRTFRLCLPILLSNFRSQYNIIDCVIYALLLFAHVTQRLCILTFLKHWSLRDLPITN